jgi:hypothetical protein
MVEIFKTNVASKRLANRVLKSLHARMPACSFNFDLDDCDRILRAQCLANKFEAAKIIKIAEEHAVEISLLEE